MKVILGFLLIVASPAWAKKHADCQVVQGIFSNSADRVENLRFETLVDIFSITNARVLSLELDGSPLRLTRSAIAVDQQTKLIYQMKKNDKTLWVANVLLDRTPNQVRWSKEYYGVLQLTGDHKEGSKKPKLRNFNFYCRF